MKVEITFRLVGICVLVTLILKNHFASGHISGNKIWSRDNKTFLTIDNVPTFQAERLRHVAKSRELEVHNFERKVLKVSYYEEANIVHFYDNDTKITGVSGELWNMLSQHLNFTMITIRSKDNKFGSQLPNGSYDGVIGLLKRNEIQVILRTGSYVAESKAMDYTTPVWDNSYRLYIRPESQTNSAWLFNMFSRRVWTSILFLFLLLSVFGYTLQRTSAKVSGDKKLERNLHDHFFYTFGTFCCQGFIPDDLYHRIRILGLSKTLFAWLLLITVSSHLISHMTNQKVQPPFTDLESMFNSTTYNIVIFKGTIVIDKFERTVNRIPSYNKYKNRTYYVSSPLRMYEKGCWGKKKYAILDSEDRQRAYGRLKCRLVAVGQKYFSTWITAGVSKNFKYKRSLDIGILKFNEFGLTDGLKDRWMAINVVNLDENAVYSITFEQVSILFTVYSMGVIASIIILLLENILFVYRDNRRQMRIRKTINSKRQKIFKQY